METAAMEMATMETTASETIVTTAPETIVIITIAIHQNHFVLSARKMGRQRPNTVRISSKIKTVSFFAQSFLIFTRKLSSWFKQLPQSRIKISFFSQILGHGDKLVAGSSITAEISPGC